MKIPEVKCKFKKAQSCDFSTVLESLFSTAHANLVLTHLCWIALAARWLYSHGFF